VDFSEDQFEHARALRDLYGVDARFVEGDVTALPFAADAFDVAFSGWSPPGSTSGGYSNPGATIRRSSRTTPSRATSRS